MFHFLTEARDQARYARSVERNLRPGGRVVMATFAPDGPERCSGLPVARHDADSLQRVLGQGFELLRSQREEHATPWGAVQAFTWALFRRR